MIWCSEIQIFLSICSISYLFSEELAYICRERTSCLVTSMRQTTQNKHQFHFVLVCLTKLPQKGAIALGCFLIEGWCRFKLSSPLHCYLLHDKQHWRKGFFSSFGGRHWDQPVPAEGGGSGWAQTENCRKIRDFPGLQLVGWMGTSCGCGFWEQLFSTTHRSAFPQW